MNSEQQKNFIERVKTYCIKHRQRLTPIRLRVLQLILQQQPQLIKAYDLMAQMQQERPCAPPTMYRALDFYLHLGLLHRTEALHAYVFCPQFDTPHHSFLFSCLHCGHISEQPAHKVMPPLEALCQSEHFTLRQEPVVLHGWCRQCSAEARRPPSGHWQHRQGCCGKDLN